MFHLTTLSVAYVKLDQGRINKCSRGLQGHFKSGLRTREAKVMIYQTLVNPF
jgi:hypothetical protein